MEDDWVDKTFTVEEAWRVLFGTMAPWKVAELGCIFQYIYEKYTEPYNEVANNFAQYDGVSMASLPKDTRIPAGCIQGDTTARRTYGDENQLTLAALGPMFFYKFKHQESFLDRRDLILSNGRPFIWSLPDICPGPDGCLPLLYPVDRFNFGEDLVGLKTFLTTLPPSQRPNLLCDRYFLSFYDGSDAFEEIFDVQVGSSLWQWGFALREDERLQEWNPPIDYEAAFNYR